MTPEITSTVAVLIAAGSLAVGLALGAWIGWLVSGVDDLATDLMQIIGGLQEQVDRLRVDRDRWMKSAAEAHSETAMVRLDLAEATTRLQEVEPLE